MLGGGERGNSKRNGSTGLTQNDLRSLDAGASRSTEDEGR
jgi:hypothetical protein